MSVSPAQAPAGPPAGEGASALSAAWIRSSEEFARLEADWCELFLRSRASNAFLSFDWMFTWWKHWGAGRRLAILTLRDSAGRLVAIAPFYCSRVRGRGPWRLGFLADQHVGSDHLALLLDPVREQEASDAVARALVADRRNWSFVEFLDTQDSPSLSRVLLGLKQAGMSEERKPASICRYVPLTLAFEEYLAGLSPNLRSNYRRRWRVIRRQSEISFTALEGAAAIEHFPVLVRLHRQRFEQLERESAFSDPRVLPFHQEAAGRLARRGLARLLVLRVGPDTVAALYGFSVGSTFQFFQSGMDPAWIANGVGQLMIGSSLDEAIRTGHREFDFLRGDEWYKRQWAPEFRTTWNLRVFDRRLASRVARAVLLGENWARAARHRIAGVLHGFSGGKATALRDEAEG